MALGSVLFIKTLVIKKLHLQQIESRAQHTDSFIASYCRPSNEFTAKPWSFDGGSRLKAKWNWKIICERIADQKRIFCNIIVNGKFRKFPGSCWGALALQNRILLQYQHLLSPQFYLPAYDVNAQTLCPFSLSSCEKVYLLKPNSDR